MGSNRLRPIAPTDTGTTAFQREARCLVANLQNR